MTARGTSTKQYHTFKLTYVQDERTWSPGFTCLRNPRAPFGPGAVRASVFIGLMPGSVVRPEGQ